MILGFPYFFTTSFVRLFVSPDFTTPLLDTPDKDDLEELKKENARLKRKLERRDKK